MCLILLAWQADPRWRLVVAANRDERHDRASDAARCWPELPEVFAGRDRVAGGSWLGISRAGRFAALTNHRDLRRPPRAAESRGALVRGFLAGRQSPLAYLEGIACEQARWLPFNLLVGDADALACLSTEAAPGAGLQPVSPGIHGVSNDVLDSPWPKVRIGRQRLAEVLAGGAADPVPALFALLGDRQVHPDAELPDTGLPLARERDVSAAMIVDPVYGTRCATVLLVDHQGRWRLVERSFDAAGRISGEVEAHHRG